jgi:mannitol-1-phosphate 5-dehydrogenase
MNVVVFGAGSTGRGHLGALISEYTDAELVFIDRKPELIDALRASGRYTIRLLGPVERSLTVGRARYLHRRDRAEVAEAVAWADVVLTAVIANNLPDVGEGIASGIRARMLAGEAAPLNVMACENLDRASTVLAGHVREYLNEAERAYAEAHVGFADTMISRVVPLALHDPLRLTAEDYNEWYVRRSSIVGTPPKLPFVNFVDDLDAYLERKLWIHNGGHATVAYAGRRKGIEFIHEAVADPEIAAFAGGVLGELGQIVLHKHPFSADEIQAYCEELVERGSIAEMRDSIARVVRDPIRKLGRGDRLMAPALYAEAHGLPNGRIIRSVLNVLAYRSDEDAEACAMASELAGAGLESFLRGTLGLGDCPSLVAKIVGASEEEAS